MSLPDWSACVTLARMASKTFDLVAQVLKLLVLIALIAVVITAAAGTLPAWLPPAAFALAVGYLVCFVVSRVVRND